MLGVGVRVDYSEDRMQKSLERRWELYKGMVIDTFVHIINGIKLSQIAGPVNARLM